MSYARQISQSVVSILRARCPRCHQGRVTKGLFAMHRRCPSCDYDLHPEPGFYMGAMAVGFMFSAIVIVPPTIGLKLLGVDILFLVSFPLLMFVGVGPFLLFYFRILWLHLEFRMTRKLDGESR